LFKGTLHVISELPITPSADVTINFGMALVAGTVQYCTPRNDRYLICVSVTPPTGTRRRDPRLPVDQSCLLTALDCGSSVRLNAVIMDISASGMGVRISQSLKIGTMIWVQAGGFVAAGQLLHCRRLEGGQFGAGLELTDILYGEEERPDTSGSQTGWLRRILRAMHM
jgi:hypothetical protein